MSFKCKKSNLRLVLYEQTLFKNYIFKLKKETWFKNFTFKLKNLN